MNPPNAFVGRAEPPNQEEVAGVLGSAETQWETLIAWMGEELGVREQEWKGVLPRKYGWTLRLKQRKRNIVYLSPCGECFRAAFILSDRAMEKVRATHFPADVAKAIAEAPHYPEGTGITLLIKRPQDLASVRKLAAIKIAN